MTEPLSIRAAAAALGLRSHTSLSRLKQRGLLDAYITDGGKILLEPAGEPSLAAWVRSCTQQHATPALPATGAEDDAPPYEISRAKSEQMRAALLELELRQKEGALLPREQFERVSARVAAIVRTRLLACPSKAKHRLPHLSLHDVAVIDDLIREALEELADGR